MKKLNLSLPKEKRDDFNYVMNERPQAFYPFSRYYAPNPFYKIDTKGRKTLLNIDNFIKHLL